MGWVSVVGVCACQPASSSGIAVAAACASPDDKPRLSGVCACQRVSLKCGGFLLLDSPATRHVSRLTGTRGGLLGTARPGRPVVRPEAVPASLRTLDSTRDVGRPQGCMGVEPAIRHRRDAEMIVPRSPTSAYGFGVPACRRRLRSSSCSRLSLGAKLGRDEREQDEAVAVGQPSPSLLQARDLGNSGCTIPPTGRVHVGGGNRYE